jgi:SARP family transcriptional regulator, regulator of embCAB operon
LLRVLLTGRLTVTDGERTVDETSMPGTLGRATFAVLALERQRVAHDVLADRLWGEEPPAGWSKSLPPIVSKLRTRLRHLDDGSGTPTIEARDGGYALVLPPSVWIDVEDAARRLDRAEAALRKDELEAAWPDAAAATAILRRPFLTGVDSRWADDVRSQLADRRHRAWLVVAEVWRRRGDHHLARTAATAAIEADPYREDGHRLLVEVELESGNRASAQRAGRRCVELLRDDLGVEPSEQTFEVLRRAGV